MSETVRYETDGTVGVITLNRPDALNAMSGELLDTLVQRGQEAAADEAVRCVVVTGAGRAFCSGGDLKGIGSGDELDPLGGTAQLRRFEEISRLLAEMPKPTIAAVNGAAAGAGSASSTGSSPTAPCATRRWRSRASSQPAPPPPTRA